MGGGEYIGEGERVSLFRSLVSFGELMFGDVSLMVSSVVRFISFKVKNDAKNDAKERIKKRAML